MTWRVWCEAYESTGQFADTTLYQNLKFTDNYVITGMRAWIVLVDNPSFANLQMKIYANDDDQLIATPTELLKTSTNSYSNSQILTVQDYGIKDIYFNFDNFIAKKDTTYNFVLNGTSYFPTATSYIAWKKAFPDPVIANGYTPTTINSNQAPYELYAYGARL